MLENPVSLQIPCFANFLFFQRYLSRYESIWAVPFQGWSVEIHPVRSTAVVLALILMEDHAFNPAATVGGCAVDRSPFVGFIGGGSAASLLGPLRMRSVGVTWAAWELFRNS